MTVSKSTLKRAKTPIQRKRLLSFAAAIGDEEREGGTMLGAAAAGKARAASGWSRRDKEEEKVDHGDEDESGVEIQRLDSETGQTIISKETGTAMNSISFWWLLELHIRDSYHYTVL